ncbi:MAG: murein biosynthesis integral membrane protein MurJ [Rhodospirillaceae bacterium]|jgi:putative peptidoglycan lipid II flippase|nr:murein biosynthesis integral membrane protein MurJ [Rhodospirillaceae bacterium]MBT5373595.1 murein biosynthesis integral membrane protein MurJ [Rhodospirillaceae bacterium]MBT5659435.1 murein biosynthesis integral membrane protein MurJ [Rhodospirillaceae bacterium]MBT5751395.1 murein biosynthesis integral membrane protein MurJ [Rhodospirillaceae bacterium]
MAFLRNIATVGSCTLISRALGFLRDILIAAVLGAGPVADAFFVAFKLPNFFRRLFAEGAFSAAFVPVFSGRVGLEGKDKAMVFASQAASMLMWVVLALVLLFEVAMPWFMHVLAPGFVGEPEKFGLAVEFSRITFPYILFISLVSLQGGVLNTLDRFAAMAATPILLNLCMITALISFSATTETPGHALAWSIAVAGVVQFVWLSAALKREGVRLHFGRPALSPEIKRLLKLFLPVALGAGVYQVNLIIDLIIASLLPTGAISYLYFADRVNQLPLGVVGIAVGTALLPLLARQVKAGETEAALTNQNKAIEYSMLLTLPACAALLVLAVPITVVLFERGAFTGSDASATGYALAAFACGLPAYVLIKVLAPGYFARENTATPIKIGIFAMAVNVALNLLLMGPLAHVGIALATAISAWLNAGLLGFGLWRRGHFTPDRNLAWHLSKMMAGALIMAGALWAALGLLAEPLAGSQVERFAALAGLVLGGGVLYFALAHVMGAARIDLLWRSRGREIE